MDNDKFAQIQADFEEWAKANGYSIAAALAAIAAAPAAPQGEPPL